MYPLNKIQTVTSWKITHDTRLSRIVSGYMDLNEMALFDMREWADKGGATVRNFLDEGDIGVRCGSGIRHKYQLDKFVHIVASKRFPVSDVCHAFLDQALILRTDTRRVY